MPFRFPFPASLPFFHVDDGTFSPLPHPRYAKYLEDFAAHFNLTPYIRFNTRVDKVEPLPDPAGLGGFTWRVHTRHSDGTTATTDVEAVAVCTGAHTIPSRPRWPGEDSFTGTILHSQQYHDPAPLKGQRVLVVGCGESGSDIALQVARVASSSALSMRSGPGYVIPRTFGGKVSDLDTNRANHGQPRVLLRRFKWLRRIKLALESLFLNPEHDDCAVLKAADAYNNRRGLSWAQRTGCKNTAFVEAQLYHKMSTHPDIKGFRGSTVTFVDGTTFDADFVVACTGFKPSFAFLPPDIQHTLKDVRQLWKHMFIPKYGEGLMVSGLCRPGVGSIPPLAELQARVFAAAVARKIAPTSAPDVAAVIAADRAHELALYPHDGKRLSSLVDYLKYATELADVVGCNPPLTRLFFTDLRLWAAVLCGPLCALQYRLAGPDSTYDVARATMLKMPRMPAVVLAWELAVLAACKSAAALGVVALTPVGV